MFLRVVEAGRYLLLLHFSILLWFYSLPANGPRDRELFLCGPVVLQDLMTPGRNEYLSDSR